MVNKNINERISPGESSLIRKISYNNNRKVLEIELETNDGNTRVYFYEGVPREVVIDFLAADSKGKFYNENIKGEYRSF